MDPQTYGRTISYLPPEMIVKIFEFLSVRQRLTASGTCREWRQLAFCPIFIEKVRIRIDESNYKTVFRDSGIFVKYRNASIHSNEFHEPMLDTLAEFFRMAPLESLVIDGDRQFINTFVDDRLLSVNALTKLRMGVKCFDRSSGNILTIVHPNLQSVSIDHGRSKGGRVDLYCPQLTDLTIGRNTEIPISALAQLQHQLQSLEIFCHDKHFLEMLEYLELSNLKKFRVVFCMSGGIIEPSFGRMVNLEELLLDNEYHTGVTLGEKLGVLTSLSKLTLSRITVDVEGFANALCKMVNLEDLRLDHCGVRSYTGEGLIISDHIRNLHLAGEPIIVPYCPKLQSLTLKANDFSCIDKSFVRACDIYPKLEKLHISVDQFHSPESFLHIEKLTFLKELHLTRLDLSYLDWTALSRMMSIETLCLELCFMESYVVLQLVDLLEPRLKQLFLLHCRVFHPKPRVFEIHGDLFDGLRDYLPRCRVWCKNCKVVEKTIQIASHVSMDIFESIQSIGIVAE